MTKEKCYFSFSNFLSAKDESSLSAVTAKFWPQWVIL